MLPVHSLKFAVAVLSITCVVPNTCEKIPKLEHANSKNIHNIIVVRELEIVSKVVFRYAHVVVRCNAENTLSFATEISVRVRIPKAAFITSFVYITNNKTVTAVINEKTAVKRYFSKVKKHGMKVGDVTLLEVTNEFDHDVFDVAVYVAAKSVIGFRLEYEELLERHAGKYSQKLYIDSEHIVPNMVVKCEFHDKQMFRTLTYKTPFYPERVHAVYTSRTLSNEGFYVGAIDWKPSEREQKNALMKLAKPFEAEFELEVNDNGGIVFTNDRGEFAHMFSVPCDENKIMNKQIVFVIDISGSMDGNPIEQVKEAMSSILTRLRHHDYFNIILFSGTSVTWNGNFQQATMTNVKAAKGFIVEKVKADGHTNINDALILAVNMFDQGDGSGSLESFGRIIVFLTDGSPTKGETDTSTIRRNIRARNYFDGDTCCKTSINTIAFGKYADKDFLQVIAHEHEGILTIIKETESNLADGELIQVYKGIENPYYKNLIFNFTTDNETIPPTNITQTQFLQYDCGNEIIVSGWTYPEAEVQALITAHGKENEIMFKSVPIVSIPKVYADILFRLVVYQKIKSYLKTAETTLYQETREIVNILAVQLSRKYGFVTPLTSLVVTDYYRRPSKHSLGHNEANITKPSMLKYVFLLLFCIMYLT